MNITGSIRNEKEQLLARYLNEGTNKPKTIITDVTNRNDQGRTSIKKFQESSGIPFLSTYQKKGNPVEYKAIIKANLDTSYLKRNQSNNITPLNDLVTVPIKEIDLGSLQREIHQKRKNQTSTLDYDAPRRTEYGNVRRRVDKNESNISCLTPDR